MRAAKGLLQEAPPGDQVDGKVQGPAGADVATCPPLVDEGGEQVPVLPGEGAGLQTFFKPRLDILYTDEGEGAILDQCREMGMVSEYDKSVVVYHSLLYTVA